MSECMPFSASWEEFLQEYSFKDKEQIYTNGSELIPVFRVRQMMEHYLVEKQVAEYWYQGYYKLLGELANYEWVSVKDRLPEKEGVYIGFIQYNSACSWVTPVRYIKQSFGEYWWWWIFEKSYTNHITHWMHLPTPPKGG